MNKIIFIFLFLLNNSLPAQTRAYFKNLSTQKKSSSKTRQVILNNGKNTKNTEIESKVISILKKYLHDTSFDITKIYKDYSPTLFDLKTLLRQQYYTDRFNKYYSNFSESIGNNINSANYNIENYTFEKKILSDYNRLLNRFFKKPNIYYYELCLKKSTSSLNLSNLDIVFEIFEINDKLVFIHLDLLNHY